jgi:hypothetical protein
MYLDGWIRYLDRWIKYLDRKRKISYELHGETHITDKREKKIKETQNDLSIYTS